MGLRGWEVEAPARPKECGLVAVVGKERTVQKTKAILFGSREAMFERTQGVERGGEGR